MEDYGYQSNSLIFCEGSTFILSEVAHIEDFDKTLDIKQ